MLAFPTLGSVFPGLCVGWRVFVCTTYVGYAHSHDKKKKIMIHNSKTPAKYVTSICQLSDELPDHILVGPQKSPH